MEGIDINLLIQNSIAVGLAVWVIKEGLLVNRQLLEMLIELIRELIDLLKEKTDDSPLDKD